MNRKLTISIDEAVYNGLHATVGERKIGRFIEELVKPHVIKANLLEAYQEMAADEAREKKADEWTEGLIGDFKQDA